MVSLLLIYLSLRGFHKSDATIPTEPTIDAEYLLKNLNCGEFPNQAKARLSNSIPSSVQYPWAIMVIRECWNDDIATYELCSFCGGTVITKK